MNTLLAINTLSKIFRNATSTINQFIPNINTINKLLYMFKSFNIIYQIKKIT
jgi:hypothetical protein